MSKVAIDKVGGDSLIAGWMRGGQDSPRLNIQRIF